MKPIFLKSFLPQISSFSLRFTAQALTARPNVFLVHLLYRATLCYLFCACCTTCSCDAMLARFVMALCLSVSVSLTSPSSIETVEWIDLVSGTKASFDLHSVVRKFGVPPKIRLKLELCPKLWTRKIRHGKSNSRWRCQQNSSMVQLVDHTNDGRHVVAGRA